MPLKAYTDYAEMLADDTLDIIDVCTPHPFHPDQTIAAAKAGKHLIIEKPIALSFEEARRVKAAVDEAKVKTCVCFELRFSAHFAMIRAILDAGPPGRHPLRRGRLLPRHRARGTASSGGT